MPSGPMWDDKISQEQVKMDMDSDCTFCSRVIRDVNPRFYGATNSGHLLCHECLRSLLPSEPANAS